jgi:rRNA biogenesis protein RRP5
LHYANSQSFHAVFRSELGIPPGSSPEEAFQLGQVIKCRVLRSSSADQRLALSFITSSAAIAAARAAGASTNGSVAPPTVTAPGATVTGQVELGALVSGAVRTVGESSFMVEVARSTGGSVNGVLGFQHLSDHASQVEGLKALLQPGQMVEDLLVIGEESWSRKIVCSWSSVT